MLYKKLDCNFFNRDALIVAPELIGKILVRKFEDNREMRLRIIETEAYRGVEDKACHASKGRTARTEPMFMDAGTIYVYLIYGMYWMLNFVCEREGEPQAVLIRGLEGYSGPGKLTKAIRIDKSFNKKNICNNDLIWIEDDGYKAEIITSSRIGINYAGEPWASKPWNFKMKDLRL